MKIKIQNSAEKELCGMKAQGDWDRAIIQGQALVREAFSRFQREWGRKEGCGAKRGSRTGGMCQLGAGEGGSAPLLKENEQPA